MSTKSTTIRINLSTKETIGNLDFVRKDTFDEIILKLIEFYENHDDNQLLLQKNIGLGKDSTDSTTIRIKKSTKETMENLDFVRKDTFDQILNKLIIFYEKNKNAKK
jgi:hypothetical protein